MVERLDDFTNEPPRDFASELDLSNPAGQDESHLTLPDFLIRAHGAEDGSALRRARTQPRGQSGPGEQIFDPRNLGLR